MWPCLRPNEVYERYAGPASTSSKPFMIGEWGVFGMDRPNWTADMFAWLEAHPQVKGQLSFNIASSDADSELQDYPLSAEVFRDGVDGTERIVDPGAVGGPEALPAP